MTKCTINAQTALTLLHTARQGCNSVGKSEWFCHFYNYKKMIYPNDLAKTHRFYLVIISGTFLTHFWIVQNLKKFSDIFRGFHRIKKNFKIFPEIWLSTQLKKWEFNEIWFSTLNSHYFSIVLDCNLVFSCCLELSKFRGNCSNQTSISPYTKLSYSSER